MNIIVIGGGAAGLMAAGTAAEQGANVTLFETNEKVGRKLFITGKGRCNVCNDCDAQEVLRNVPVNPRFLYSALGAFSPADVKAFFEEKGVRAAQSRKWRVTTSVGSVTAVRFITLFFSSSSAENFNKSSIIFSLTSGRNSFSPVYSSSRSVKPFPPFDAFRYRSSAQ